MFFKTLLLKNLFSIQPNRAHRYFTLTLNLNKQIPLSCTSFINPKKPSYNRTNNP